MASKTYVYRSFVFSATTVQSKCKVSHKQTLLLLLLLNIFDDALLRRRVTAESWAQAVTWTVSEMRVSKDDYAYDREQWIIIIIIIISSSSTFCMHRRIILCMIHFASLLPILYLQTLVIWHVRLFCTDDLTSLHQFWGHLPTKYDPLFPAPKKSASDFSQKSFKNRFGNCANRLKMNDRKPNWSHNLHQNAGISL